MAAPQATRKMEKRIMKNKLRCNQVN